MPDLNDLLAMFCVLVLLWMLIYLGANGVSYFLKGRNLSLNSLTWDFRPKIWMTVGLGVTFFGLYLFALLLFSDSFNTAAWLKTLMQNPVEGIYLGLFIFAFFSLAICLIRLMIKYLYNRFG